MSEVNKIANYNQMMSWLTRPEPPKTQVASAETDALKEQFNEELGPGTIKTLDELPPIQDPFKNFEDRNPRETAAQGGVIGEGGMIRGEDLGTREGFNDPLKKPGDYKYSGVQQHLAGENKGQFYFKIRNPNYEGKGSGTPSTLNMGPYKTKKEAEKKYIERQSKMGDIKVSAKNKTIRDQTLKINNFLDNFIDNNLNKFGIRDYEKFKEQLNKAFEKSGIKDIPGRKAKAGDLPNLGTYESEVPFTKFNLEPAFKQKIRKDLGVSSNIENFYKKIFFSGVLENNPDFKNKISKYLDYENIDKKFYKGNPNQIDRTAINKEYADVLTPKFKKDFIYMMDEMANPVLRGTIFKKYFGPKYENYIEKRNSAMLKYEQDKKIIEEKFTPEELKKILGETSIRKFMNKQHELLNKIFDTSVFTGADKGFTFAADHLEGIAEIAKYENKDDIARGLLNVVGTTADRNLELGWKTLSRQRGDLINKIQKGVNVDANVEELNRISKLSYPDIKGDEFYKYDPKTKNVIPTKDFTVKYSPEEGFKRYFTELSYDPRSLKILKSQYKTNPNFKDFVQKDPELTSAIDKTYNKMIEVLQNPKFKNILQNSGLTLRGLGQMRRGNIPGFLNTMEKLVQKNPDFRVELGDPYKDIENQLASASIMSDVSPVQKETTQEGENELRNKLFKKTKTENLFDKDTELMLTGAGATIARYAKPFIKAFISPGTGITLSALELMKENPNLSLAGAEMLLPEIYQRTKNKVPDFIDNVLGFQGINTLVDKYPKLKKFKPVVKFADTVGKSSRIMTPAGLALIGKDVYDEFDKTVGFDQRGPLTEKELLDMREKETYMGSIADAFDKAYKQNNSLPGQEGIDTLKQKFSVGGRVNFKDGSENAVITIDDKIDEMISFYQDYLKQGGKMDFVTFSKQYIPENFAAGGRVGFADGPEDPGKRKFMKIMGGLASLPIVGRLFDVAQVAEKAAPVVQKSFEGAPAYFINLVKKIKNLGDDVTEKVATSEREIVTEYKDYRLTEDLTTGRTTIQKTKLEANEQYYDETLAEQTYMDYIPGKGQADETTGKVADEYIEDTAYLRTSGPQKGEVLEVVDGVPDDVIQDGTKFEDDFVDFEPKKKNDK